MEVPAIHHPVQSTIKRDGAEKYHAIQELRGSQRDPEALVSSHPKDYFIS